MSSIKGKAKKGIGDLKKIWRRLMKRLDSTMCSKLP
jgi:hypothetical protein